MAHTSTVTVERRVTDHKTLKVSLLAPFFTSLSRGSALTERWVASYLFAGVQTTQEVLGARPGGSLRRRGSSVDSQLSSREQVEAVRAVGDLEGG